MNKSRTFSSRKKITLGVITLVLILALAISFNAVATANPGEVTVDKTAAANGDGTYNVSINVTGAPFTTGTEAGRYDVVLVIDRSTSMNTDMPGDTQGTRLDAAKAAAVSFVNAILGDSANINNRVALVSFGTDGQQVQDFTGKASKQTLINKINGLNAGSYSNIQYTNIQEGLIYARDYIDNDANASANKIVVLLSDGEPTRSVNDLYWDNDNGDTYYRYLQRSEMDADVYPSSYNNDGSDTTVRDRYIDRIIVEANKIRALGADIYSIGINASATMAKALGNDATYHFSRNSGVAAWQTSSPSRTWSIPWPYNAQSTATQGSTTYTGDYLIPGFNDFKVAYAKAYYTTSNSDDLSGIFEGLVEQFSEVATGGVLTDKLPEYFNLVLSSLPAGASYDAATRTISWAVGSIGTVKNLTYTVTPVAGYWGDGYTNASTNLSATAVDENPFYTPSKAISIDVLSPVRHDDGVVGDKYAGTDDTVNGVDRKTPVTIQVGTAGIINSGVIANDTVTSLIYVSQTDNGGVYNSTQKVWFKTVNAQPYLYSGTGYDPQYGSVVQNADGSFTYTYNTSIAYDLTKTVDYFYYYLADADDNEDTASAPIKVTINLKELAEVKAEYRNFSATPDPVTGYPKIVGDETLIKQVDESVVYVDVQKDLLSQGFVYDHGVPELKAGNLGAIPSYTVVSGTNTLVLYYISANCTVDVYFKDYATNAIIKTKQTLTGTYNTTYTIPQPTIAGYTYRSTDNPNGSAVYKLTNQDITVYYDAKTLNSNIHYVDVTDATANGDGSYSGGSSITNYPDVRYEGKIGDTIPYIVHSINGYNYIGTFGSSVFTDPEHDVYIYYTKKTDLSVDIKYVVKDSDPEIVLDTDKIENGTFGEAYTVDKPATIGGYQYHSINDLNGGVFKDPCDTVYVYYVPRDTEVDVQYVEYDPNTTDHIGQLLDDDTINGKYGDVKTVATPNITDIEGYVYKYYSINNPYQGTNTDPKDLTMVMDMDTDIIVFMTKTPVEITVHFYEVGETDELLTTGPDMLEGYVGGSYATALTALEGTLIDGFVYDSTDDPNSNTTYDTDDEDIIIYYTRVATKITVLHHYTDDAVDAYFGASDVRDGDYEDTTSIDPLTPKDGYDFVGYEVDTDEGDSLTAYDGSEIDAEFGLEDYTVTLLYAPTSGNITVHYLEVDTTIGDTALHTADTYYGNYEYEEISVDPATGEETTTTVPAQKFYGSDVETPSVTGFHATGSVTLLPSSDFSDDADYTEFLRTAQNIVVWYARDTIELPLEHVDELGNKLVTPDESISGDYGTSFVDEAVGTDGTSGKIKTDITGYTYKEMTTTGLTGTTYPATVPGDAMVTLVYEKKPVSLTVKYLDIDTGLPVKASTTMPEDGSNALYGESFTMSAAPGVTGYDFDHIYNPHETSADNHYVGTYPDPADKHDIIYYYELKEVSVDVEYVEAVDDGEGGTNYLPMNDGDDDYTITKDFGSDYSVTVIGYTGFTYSGTENGNGSKMSEGMSTIYVVYTRDPAEAIVKYVESGHHNNVLGTAEIDGYFGKPYVLPTNPGFHGWSQNGDPIYPNADHVYTTDEEQIIYVPYTRDTMDMTLRYQLVGASASDSDIQDPYEFSGPFDTHFSLDNDEGLFDIFGYNLYTALPITGTYQDENPTVFAYYQKNFYSYPVEYRYTGDSRLLDTDVVSGYFGDSYSVERKTFTGYRFSNIDDPFGGVFSRINNQEQVITVWYDKRSNPPDDDEDEDEDEEEEVPEEPTPENPPVIEPEEPGEEVPEDEVPNAPVPDTGGTVTYLIPLLGLALIVAGGAKLIKTKR